MVKSGKTLRWLGKLLKDKSKTLVFQNAKYDLKMFSFEGFDVLRMGAKYECTLIMSKVINSVSDRHDLRSLAIKYLKADVADKDEVEEWIKKNSRAFKKEHGRKPTFRDAPLDVVRRRCMWDTRSTLRIYQILRPKVDEVCPSLYETERKLALVCIDMENTGVRVDITRAKELRDNAVANLTQIKDELNALVCPLEITRSKRGKIETEEVNEFNPNSSQGHIPAAFRKMGIKLLYKTKPKKGKKGGRATGGGNWSFDEYSMLRYAAPPLAKMVDQAGKENWSASKFIKTTHRLIRKHKLHPKEYLPPLILQYRQLSKMVSTYYSHLIEDCVDVRTEPNGREYGILHCRFNQSEAMTGRFSSSNPNLQNMPRQLGPRECFVPRLGRRWWHADYSQIEMKMFIHFAQDQKMADNLAKDLHRMTASGIFGKKPDKITSEERKQAKGVNFGVIYGSGAATMAETLTKKGVPTTVARAHYFVQAYHTMYPTVRKTICKLKKDLSTKGYVTNPFGRRYRIPIRFAYKALNYMCQGTSADIIKAAMVELWLWLRKNNFKTRMILTIHDEVVLEMPQSEERRVLPKVKAIMEDQSSYFVPITIDFERVTTRWSEKVKASKIESYKWLCAA